MSQCQPRWIVRPPAILTTPNILKELLEADRTKKYSYQHLDRYRKKFSYEKDLLLVYPHPSVVVEGKTQEYLRLYSFFSGDKPSQRSVLEQCGVPTIPFRTRKDRSLEEQLFTDEPQYIVRPLRHSGGKDYKITVGPEDFIEGKEYISVFFPKKREYRVVFYRGFPIITLRKRVPSSLNNLQPWNHANGSTFITVSQDENNHLLKTDFYEKLKDVFFVKDSHLIGVDVLLDKDNNYVVVEVNCCPALTIESNLDLLKKTHQQQFCEANGETNVLSVSSEPS